MGTNVKFQPDKFAATCVSGSCNVGEGSRKEKYLLAFKESSLTVVICTHANVLEVTIILHVKESEFEKGVRLLACLFSPCLTSHVTRTYYMLVPSS
jgi:hypothetical protein